MAFWQALNVLVAWNGANFIRGRIRLNKPAVWTINSGEYRVSVVTGRPRTYR
jgi:hypothetical protein